METIRYYQRRGLIATPSKPLGGHRHYPDLAVRRLAFIRRAQLMGFTLDEIAALLREGDSRQCSTGLRFANSKVEEIDQRIEELRRMRKTLHDIAMRCESRPLRGDCHLIRALYGEAD